MVISLPKKKNLQSILFVLLSCTFTVTSFVLTPLPLPSTPTPTPTLLSSPNHHLNYNTHQSRRRCHTFLSRESNSHFPCKRTSTCSTTLSSQRITTSSLSSTVTDTNNDIDTSQSFQNENEKYDNNHVQVSFSHVHLYTDHLEDIHVYKQLEQQLNTLVQKHHGGQRQGMDMNGEGGSKFVSTTLDIQRGRNVWGSIVHDGGNDDDLEKKEEEDQSFVPQGRDLVKQLIAGLGFRVTGERYETNKSSSTRNLVLTTKDSSGVQIVISALHDDTNNDDLKNGNVDVIANDHDEYCHFDPQNIKQFYNCHADRQGIAVLAFSVSSGTIETLHQRYLDLHPNLLVEEYSNDVKTYSSCKVLEVYSYYKGDKGGEVDKGTRLRFVQQLNDGDDHDHDNDENYHCLPGIVPIDATFDETCMSAYCDHWVSNVISRTGFIETLEETLGFTPKVDFNAGVVAAGEAQIESTVTGNDSNSIFEEHGEALRDQSQVYLPINNALSEVGHVHGFIEEIGQGIQHIASRVDDLPAFVQRGNDFREITGEGLTFLKIPRSYYGVLTAKHLMDEVEGLTHECTSAVIRACEEAPGRIMSKDGAIDLNLTMGELLTELQSSSILQNKFKDEFDTHQNEIVSSILRSRYNNLYNLLGENLSAETYMAIVRNQILVDVQGNDLLFQIFTSNVLQRKPGDESPFLEFIQRVCSSGGGSDVDGSSSSALSCPVEMKAGCGGFGIRNFLTLFLSIEVGKAMLDVSTAKETGDINSLKLAEKKVSLFTEQLNESNPILTAISDAMTEEGNALNDLEEALRIGDEEATRIHRQRKNSAESKKNASNQDLMTCSTKYNNLMKSLRAIGAS